jgi:hypothetical protein
LILDRGLLRRLVELGQATAGPGRREYENLKLKDGSLVDRSHLGTTSSWEGPSADGGTYIVLRRCQGVQIGNHNTQRAHFHYVMKGPEADLGDVLDGAHARHLIDLYRQQEFSKLRRELAGLVEEASFDLAQLPVMGRLTGNETFDDIDVLSLGDEDLKQYHTAEISTSTVTDYDAVFRALDWLGSKLPSFDPDVNKIPSSDSSKDRIPSFDPHTDALPSSSREPRAPSSDPDFRRGLGRGGIGGP